MDTISDKSSVKSALKNGEASESSDNSEIGGHTDENKNKNLPTYEYLRAHKELLKLYELIDSEKKIVKNIRATAIRRQIDREDEEEAKRAALDSYIATLEIQTVEDYNKMSEEWDQIFKIRDPSTLKKETANQREKCTVFLEDKFKTITFLKSKLKEKDVEFQAQIEDQTTEINQLLQKVEEQIITLKDVYTKQLDNLEEIIDEEKTSVMKANKENWEILVEEKDEADQNFFQKLNEILQKQQDPIILAEKNYLEYKNKIRAKLDKYVRDLTIETNILKSICTLNIEKLSYNYDLLIKKQHDNELTKRTYRNNITSAIRHLNETRKRIQDEKSAMYNQICIFDRQISNLSTRIIAIDKRCTEIALLNFMNYFKLWDFMEGEANEIVEQILCFNKIMHEQYLRVTPRTSPPKERRKPPSFMAALNAMEVLRREKYRIYKSPAPNCDISPSSPAFKKFSKLVLDATKYFLLVGTGKGDSGVQGDAVIGELEKNLKIFGVSSLDDIITLVKCFVPYITCPECEYSDHRYNFRPSEEIHINCEVDDDTSLDESLLSLPTESYKSESTQSDVSSDIDFMNNEKYKFELIRKNILRDLEIQSLYGLMDGCQNAKVCNSMDSTTPMNAEEMKYENELVSTCVENNHRLFINPLDVGKALKEFTFDLCTTKARNVNFNAKEILEKQRIHLSQLLDNNEVKIYWQEILALPGCGKIWLWENMTECLFEYSRSLQKRHELNEKIKKKLVSNNDLKRLLLSYTADKEW